MDQSSAAEQTRSRPRDLARYIALSAVSISSSGVVPCAGNAATPTLTVTCNGGDEFTVLLVDTGVEAGLVIGQRIRAAVAAALFETRGGAPPLQVTVSVGVAAFPAHGTTPEELIETADKAMYRAKSLGRDRVCSASEL